MLRPRRLPAAFATPLRLAAGLALLLPAVAFAQAPAASTAVSSPTVQLEALGTPAPMTAEAADLTQFPYGSYAAVLTRHVDASGRIDFAGLKADRAPLDRYVRALAEFPAETYAAWPPAEKLAFWINAHNGLLLRTVRDHYPLGERPLHDARYPRNSAEQIPGLWDGLQHAVLGKPVTLQQIREERIGRQFGEPRVHLALIDASRGGALLHPRPYRGDSLDQQLALQALRFFEDPTHAQVDRARGHVRLSRVFKEHGADFITLYETQGGPTQAPTAAQAVLYFAAQYHPALRWPEAADWKLDFLPYDHTLNDQP